MQKKMVHLTLGAIGLTAGIFFGCQDYMSQNSDNNNNASANASTALLQLAVKDSTPCLDLHTRCALAHHLGKDSADLDTTLVKNCIVDTAAARLIASSRFEGRGYRGGGDMNEHHLDSAAAKAQCDSMTIKLGKTDSTDKGYAVLKHETSEACRMRIFMTPKPRSDSAAAKALCDSLTRVVAGADTSSAGIAMIKYQKEEACETPELMHIGRRFGHRGHGRH